MESQQFDNIPKWTKGNLQILSRLKHVLFGEEQPDQYTKVTFFLNLSIWILFFLWTIASYCAISFRQLIFEQKGIPVESIIMARGEVLGFESSDFLERLLTFHAISIVCWIFVFIGLVFLWRKKEKFIFFLFGGTIFYLVMLLFYLNYSYFKEDTTTFDKIAFLAFNANTLIYYFLLRKEKKGGTIDFFGEDE